MRVNKFVRFKSDISILFKSEISVICLIYLTVRKYCDKIILRDDSLFSELLSLAEIKCSRRSKLLNSNHGLNSL